MRRLWRPIRRQSEKQPCRTVREYSLQKAQTLLAKSADPPRHPPKEGARGLRTMGEVGFARGHTL